MPESYAILKERFMHTRARREVIISERNILLERVESLERKLNSARSAQSIIQRVAEATQRQLQYGISYTVSMALSAVFDDPEEFKIQFVKRRGRTECDLLFVKNGLEMDPIGFTGGGVLDVTCFALRVAFLCLRHNIRRILFLDEPFRNLHGVTEQERCSAMVKALSTQLGIQINMVSDVELVNRAADRVFTFRLINGITQVSDG